MSERDPDGEHATCRHGVPLATPAYDGDECDADCELERCIWADACAHRDRQTVAWLRARAVYLREHCGDYEGASLLDEAADAIERGEHAGVQP